MIRVYLDSDYDGTPYLSIFGDTVTKTANLEYFDTLADARKAVWIMAMVCDFEYIDAAHAASIDTVYNFRLQRIIREQTKNLHC